MGQSTYHRPKIMVEARRIQFVDSKYRAYASILCCEALDLENESMCRDLVCKRLFFLRFREHARARDDLFDFFWRSGLLRRGGWERALEGVQGESLSLPQQDQKVQTHHPVLSILDLREY